MSKLWGLLAIPAILYGVVEFNATAAQDIRTDKLFSLVNQERVKNGVGELIGSSALDNSARDKCIDMQQKSYWAHNAPDGTQPWVFVEKYTDYHSAGENLAYKQHSSNEVVKDWMESQGHKENILDSRYHKVGYAICDFRHNKLVVQHFTD